MRLRDIFRWGRSTEARASIEDPKVPISSNKILELFGFGSTSAAGVNVTTDVALGVPAVWAAVNFISGTIAGLPLHLYRRTKTGRERATGELYSILHDAVNDEWSSFAWRKYIFEQVLTGGRSVTFIERNAAGRVVNLWPLDPVSVKIIRVNGQKVYEYRDGKSRVLTYRASEVIDLAFMLKADQLQHRSPIHQCRDAIALAVAITNYGSKFFQGGGVPPFMIEGPFKTPAGMQRAVDDLANAIAQAKEKNRIALALPENHTVKQIGADPEKSQMIETQQFSIVQIARIYSLPPTFLQDLKFGTFSNTEQQDLQFVKHTLKKWIEQFEQEINLKLFGRRSRKLYAEFDLDGVLRGDFVTRMQGYSSAIQHGLLTPNEGRRAENRSDIDGGDQTYMQGAMVPITELSQPSEAGDSNGA